MKDLALALIRRFWRQVTPKTNAVVSDTDRKLWGLLIARLKDNRPPLMTAPGNRQLPNLSER